MAASATARAKLASDLKNYIVAHNLDGTDIDWEPPSTGADQYNYSLLIDDLYTQLHPLSKKITAASNPWTKEIPVLASQKMDWINVMCYDFSYNNHSTYSASIGSMNEWFYYGVAKNKVTMGVPFYGRYGTSWSDTHAKTYGAILTDYKAINGAYPALNIDSYTDTAGNITYFNGVTTMENKMAFIRDNGFAGAMIWELGQDHWDSSSKYDRWSLLPVIGTMMKTPSWLTPSNASFYDLVAATFYLDAGQVTFSGDAYASNPNLLLSLNSDTKLNINAPQRLANLSISGFAQVDLKNNWLIFDYASTSTPLGTWNGTNYSGLLGLIKSGRNGGALVGNWNGSGIITSQSNAKSPSMLATIGAAEASSALGISGTQTRLWNAKTVDATTVLVRYTYAGDANLDGVITGDDYFRIDSGFSAGGKGFSAGDFNYDGKVNTDDYFLIDSNYAKAKTVLAASLPLAPATYASPPNPFAATAHDVTTKSVIDELL